MVVGLLGVTGALVIGGVTLDAVLVTSLSRTVHGEVRASADEVAALVDAGRLPEPIPVSGAEIVQVLDAGGHVVGGSLTADRLTPLVTEGERRTAVSGRRVVVPANRAGLSGQLQVAAVEAGPASARVTVVAATSTTTIEASGRTLRLLLLGLLPLMLLVLGLVAWRVIGAALRPVELLRVGAERIDEASADDELLPVPPTRDEIAALATTLNEMLGRVAGARRTQRAFVADAAHELRSPLASMRTQLEVAQHLGDTSELTSGLLAEVERLSTLVEDLLLLAREGDTKPDRRTPSGPLAEVLRTAVDRYAASRVPVRLNLGSGVGLVDTQVVVAIDDRDLTRVVANIVDNAVRHAAARVDVSASLAGKFAQIVVTDDGAGIPTSDRDRVFDRFTRLDEARDRDSGGTGLGLPITRHLVARAGGSINLGNRSAGPGLAVTVALPLGQPTG
ncbi:MAG: HAMP domain-containing sensor histidine kinase [Nostocoides sp.]